MLSLLLANATSDRIKGFLERFHGEKDVASGLADLDLNEHDDAPRLQELKYMNQLVRNMRGHSLEDAYPTTAKNCEQGATDAYRRPRRRL